MPPLHGCCKLRGRRFTRGFESALYGDGWLERVSVALARENSAAAMETEDLSVARREGDPSHCDSNEKRSILATAGVFLCTLDVAAV